MTKTQYERERLFLARERELRLIAEGLEQVEPNYPISAAGFWLDRQAAPELRATFR